MCGLELAAYWLLAAAVWKWGHCACDHSRRGGDTGDDCLLDFASKGRNRINHDAQSGSSLHRLALHGCAAIDAAAAWALVSHPALCSVVRGDRHGHTACIAE